MRKVLGVMGAAAFLLAASAVPSYAFATRVKVVCDANQNGVADALDSPLANVTLTVTATIGGFTSTGTTDAEGYVVIPLQPFDADYTLTLDQATLPVGSTLVDPPSGQVSFHATDFTLNAFTFLVNSASCREGRCWLTGGGAKFSPITGGTVAQHGPQHSFGGNVNPGCNTDSGEGGQWNHVAHGVKLHFQGWQIRVVRCGNVEGIPEGSESPVTPFNFIEFEGTGTLKGIHGNKVDYGTVQFFGRAEDRNEPGSHGAKQSVLVDRYFLRVWNASNPALLLVDVDGNPLTVDPVQITDGNLQIHISSCETTQH